MGVLVAALAAVVLFPGVAFAEDGSAHSDLYYEQQQSIDELAQLNGPEFEVGYIDRVIPHHQGAIDMSQIMLERAPNQETRDLAQNAIMMQAEEINQLSTLLQEEYGLPVTPDPAFVLPESELAALENASPEAAEAQYLLGFREHHQSIIDMSEILLQKEGLPNYDELGPMAQMMIENQRREQGELAALAQEFYGIEAPEPITGDIPLGRQVALEQLGQ